MTTSILPARYKINGLIDTSRDVMENMEQLCLASGCFLSYDIHEGKWAVIINRAGSIVRSFDNSNIIGPIQVNGTSLNDLYNSVVIEYPLRDTVDQTDYVQVSIPTGDRYDNEPDNVLKIAMNMLNEPVQAEILALIQLKQSRIDQVITFQSDYSVLNLNAGDIIGVTNDVYQFNNKPFRIISLKEVDTDSGAIQIEVTALAYDANVYDISDLGRYIRSDRNGIKGIGALGTPLAPVIYVFEQDRRPGIQVEAVVPSGIVENMELWLSSDNTNFILVSTIEAPPGEVFTAGSTVLFDYDQLESQNIYVKVRAMNSTTTGPFSPTASFLSYVPQQITDVIGQNTQVQESDGSINPLLLALPVLLSLLDGFFDGDDTRSMSNIVGTANAQALSVAATEAKLDAMYGGQMGSDGYPIYDPATVEANGITLPIVLPNPVTSLTVTLTSPTLTFDYYAKDSATGTVRLYSGQVAQPPCQIGLFYGNVSAPNLQQTATIDWQQNTTSFIITNAPAGTYNLFITITPTYALNMYWDRTSAGLGQYNVVFPFNFDMSGSTVGFRAVIQTMG